MAVVRGANPPVIDRTIRQKLEEEHKILRGEKERLEIRDPAFAGMEDEEKGTADEREAEKEEGEARENELIWSRTAFLLLLFFFAILQILCKTAKCNVNFLYTFVRLSRVSLSHKR